MIKRTINMSIGLVHGMFNFLLVIFFFVMIDNFYYACGLSIISTLITAFILQWLDERRNVIPK